MGSGPAVLSTKVPARGASSLPVANVRVVVAAVGRRRCALQQHNETPSLTSAVLVTLMPARDLGVSFQDDAFPPAVALADLEHKWRGRELVWVPASMLLSGDARQR